jgi:hypothetical protein
MEQQRRAGERHVVGLLGHVGGRQVREGSTWILSISFWRDLDALTTFSGGVLERPIVTPDQRSSLEDWSVEHFESFDETGFHGVSELQHPVFEPA